MWGFTIGVAIKIKQSLHPNWVQTRLLVEVTGLEPAASASRTQRSTKLSHTSKVSAFCGNIVIIYNAVQKVNCFFCFWRKMFENEEKTMKLSPQMRTEITEKCEWHPEIHYLRETASTNTVLKQLAADGAKAGTVVFAEHQTAGRGRVGRSFFSYEDGIYMSVLFRLCIASETALLLTTAAAVAVSQTADEVFGIKTAIKWVNDIYLDDKKVCGILSEGRVDAATPCESFVVVGIGVNVCPPKDGFPPEIRNRAGALTEKQTADDEKTVALLSGILNRLYRYAESLETKPFLAEYRDRSMLTGKTVRYAQNDTVQTVQVLGIDDAARLIVLQNGREKHLCAGEVQLLNG